MTSAKASAALATILVASALIAPAFAADLPARSAPPVFVPPPIAVFSWTGLYAGIQGGYSFGKDDASGVIVTRAGSAAGSLSSSPSGVVGGGHVGYNLSTSSFLGGFGGPAGIIGIEGDGEGLDSSKTVGVAGASARIKSDLQGSIRGRLGFGIDRFLVYGTGGAAFGDFKSTYTLGPVTASTDKTRVGYTVGGGLEYAFTENWSFRAEYRYSDYGTFSDNFVRPIAGVTSVTIRHHDTSQRIEGGISYLFTTPVAPVVARY